MKRVFYIFIIIVLSLQMNVFASEDEGVVFSLECESLNIAPKSSATCDLVASTISTISIDSASITVEKDSDLSIEYEKGQFFDGNLNGENLVLSSSSLKTGNFKLGKIKITVNDTASFGKKKLTLKNVSFFDSNNTIEIYNSNNVSKEINVLSDNNNLKSIDLDGKLISGFSSTLLKYDIELDKEKVKIEAEKEESNARIEGLGEKELKHGKNTFEIKVTSQKGTVKTYVLNITRPDNRSDDNTLKTLTVEGVSLKFDSKNLNYKLNVDGDVEKIIINSTLNDTKATYVKDFGNREVELNYGENKVLIKILSEKGNEKVYTLTVNRADNRSDVAKLNSLKINENEIELTNDVYEYELTLLYRYDKTLVEAIANDKSTIEYKDIDLKVGDNELIIKVISEKGTTQEYKINVKRLTEEESKAVLENIEISGYELNFTKDVNHYNLKINEEDTELDFEVTSNDEESITYSVSGNSNLKNGSVVTINAKDDLGEYVYTINIIKDVQEQLIFGFLTIDQLCYIVFSVGAIIFICSIIYCIKAKKSKKK